MSTTDSTTSLSTVGTLLLLAGLSLSPRIFRFIGVYLFDDAIGAAGLTLAAGTLQHTTVIGLALVVLYLGYEATRHPDAVPYRPSRRELPILAGIGCYVGGVLVIWIDLRASSQLLTDLVVGISQWGYIMMPADIIDPPLIRVAEANVRRVILRSEALLLRHPIQPVRWPLYLFVTYVGVASFTDRISWQNRPSGMVRQALQLFVVTVILIYSLILSHNFFPGVNTLPWQAPTITLWVVGHTIVAGLVVGVVTHTGSLQLATQPSVSTMLLIWFVLGMTIALLSGLSPLPELCLLGGGLLVLLRRYADISWGSPELVQIAAIQDRVIAAVAMAWRDPAELSVQLPIFQGLWWGGHLIWLLVFLPGGSWWRGLGDSLLSIGVVVLVMLPLVVAGGYTIAFWLFELYRRTSNSTRILGFSRFPDLLVAPTLVIAAYLVADMVSLLMVVPLVVVGTYGMYRSLRVAAVGGHLCSRLDSIAVPAAFGIQAGAYALVGHLGPSTYGTSGVPAGFMLGTLGPLLAVPRLSETGVCGVSGRHASAGVVVAVAVFAGWSLFAVGELAYVNSVLVGVGAVVVAMERLVRDVVL